MHVVVGGVDQRVGDVADRVQQLPLLDNGPRNRLLLAQRMRAPGLGVAPHQHRILRVKKNHARVQQRFHLFENLREAVKGLTLANIHYDGRALKLGRLFEQGGKAGQQFQRQVVHGVKAQILECLEGRGLARAGDSGHDDQLFGRGFLGGFGGPARGGRPGRRLGRRHGHILHRTAAFALCTEAIQAAEKVFPSLHPPRGLAQGWNEPSA